MKSSRTPGPTHLQRLIASFGDALGALGADPTPRQIEGLSVLVHECMSGHGRHFHDVVHALEISDCADPVQVLAALFHDAIYFQVDGGFTDRARDLLEDAIATAQGGLALTEFGDDTDRALVAAVFGFSPGKVLTPRSGLNEFLSALLAVRALSPMLPRVVLAQITACIEATIAFRAPGDDRGPADDLYDRMSAVVDAFALGMKPDDIERAVQSAVQVANRDVGNFAYGDPARFLDHTWQLLPETHHSLRGQAIYTIAEYGAAMQMMQGFFDRLDPDLVFVRFRAFPPEDQFSQMCERARENVRIGRRYLNAKLVAASVLEALSLLTGGDAPISLFMGDLPSDGLTALRLEDLLPPEPPEIADDVSEEVLELLAKGRASETGFDIKHAPLGALLYQALGDAGSARAARGWPGARDDPERWLASLPWSCLRVIVEGCGRLAVTRAKELAALGERLAAE